MRKTYAYSGRRFSRYKSTPIESTTFRAIVDYPEKGIKKGKVYDSFGGLVSGVYGIPFTDTKYFKRIWKNS